MVFEIGMEIKGVAHLLFEQSGIFKNEFKKLGIQAFDYDLQNSFGETDCVIDLFGEIEKAYDGGTSIFDSISCDDICISFFPCIYFSDMSQILHTWGAYPGRDVMYATDTILERSRKRQQFYEIAVKMLAVAKARGIRLIMENPCGTHSYIMNSFVTPPAFIDKDRSERGDHFRKPTAYWFINCEPSCLHTSNKIHQKKRVKKDFKDHHNAGVCNEDRSMITSDYARNFICDNILGKPQKFTQLSIF